MTDPRGSIANWLGVQRPVRERIVGGVCQGLSRRFRVDVTLVRMAFLVLVLASGLGLVAYGALWLVLPPEGMTRMQEARQLRARAQRSTRQLSVWPQPVSRKHVAAALLAGGCLWMLGSFGMFSWVTAGRALGLAAIAVGAGLLVTLSAPDGRSDRGQHRGQHRGQR